MSRASCKAAICSTNLAATATTINNRLEIDNFSEGQLEKIIEISDKANKALLEVATGTPQRLQNP